MIANCKQNRECLMALLDSIQDGLLSAKECKDINSEYFFYYQGRERLIQ